MVRSTFQRLICLGLLLAYAVAGTAIVPAALLTLATVDGGHAIFVNESSGGTQLILHHRPLQRTPKVGDHSSAVTRLVVRLCRPAGETDHRMVSPHMTGKITTPSGEEEKDQDDPVLNDQATIDLVLAMHSSHVRGMTRADSGWNLEVSGMQQLHQALASVQMLI